jgi:hypothetical protein
MSELLTKVDLARSKVLAAEAYVAALGVQSGQAADQLAEARAELAAVEAELNDAVNEGVLDLFR